MTIHVQITLDGEDLALVQSIGALINNRTSSEGKVERLEPTMDKPKKKAAALVEIDDEDEKPAPKRSKKPLAVVEDEPEESEEPESEDESDEEIEQPKKRGPGRPPKASKLTLTGDIIPAFRAFAEKHGDKGMKKAAAILQQFGAKKPQDIAEEDYPEVIKALKG